ncbi:MAG: hypothetical protein WD065_08270, partial [Planctomycetaceae bacterium]
MSVVVIKIGGSLLDLPDLDGRLIQVLPRIKSNTDASEGFQPLFIIGGGRMADVVRGWDRIHRLGDEAAHHLAMATLAVNESLLLELLPDSVHVKNRDEAETAWGSRRLPLLKTADFIAAEEASHLSIDPLPHDWTVTSDSLAAWVAAAWPASRLVLLKSAYLPGDVSKSQWAERQLVDRYFPHVMPLVPRVDWINLRAEEYGAS